MARANTDIAALLDELLGAGFFAEGICPTESQGEAFDGRRCLLQAMMLLDRNYVPGFEVRDFSETSLLEYTERVRKCYGDKQEILLRSAVQYLTDAFPERSAVVKGMDIPMLVYLADVAEDERVEPLRFGQWWKFFTEEDALFVAYRGFCGRGSEGLDWINGRLAVMAESFSAYHGIGMPEELKGMAAEVADSVRAAWERDGLQGQ